MQRGRIWLFCCQTITFCLPIFAAAGYRFIKSSKSAHEAEQRTVSFYKVDPCGEQSALRFALHPISTANDKLALLKSRKAVEKRRVMCYTYIK